MALTKKHDLRILKRTRTIEEAIKIFQGRRETSRLGDFKFEGGDLVRALVNGFFIDALKGGLGTEKHHPIPYNQLAPDRYELFLGIAEEPKKSSGEWGDYEAVILYMDGEGRVSPAYKIKIPKRCSGFIECRRFMNPRPWLRVLR